MGLKQFSGELVKVVGFPSSGTSLSVGMGDTLESPFLIWTPGNPDAVETF